MNATSSFFSAGHDIWAATLDTPAEARSERASPPASSWLDAADAEDQRIEGEREAVTKKLDLENGLYHHLVAVGGSVRGMAPEPVRSPGGHLTASGELAECNVPLGYVARHLLVPDEPKQCDDEYCSATTLLQQSIQAAMRVAAKAFAALGERRLLPGDIVEQYKRDFKASFASFMQPVLEESPVSTTGARLDPAAPANSPVEMLSTVDKSFASVSSQATIDATTGRPFTLRVQQVDAMPQESSRTRVTKCKKSFLNAPLPPVAEHPTSELIDDNFLLPTIPAPLWDRVTNFKKSLLGARGSRTTRRPTPEPIDDAVPLQSSPTPAHPYIGKRQKRTRLESSVEEEDEDNASVMSQRPAKKLRSSSSAGIKINFEPFVAGFENDEEL